MKPLVVSRGIFDLRVFFVSCLLLLLPGLSATAQDRASSLPLMFDKRERIPKPDLASLPRIRFLTTVDFPPFNFIDQSGKLSGFHVDLAREVCRELGVIERCQIEAIPYKELGSALAEKRGEVVLAGTRITRKLREDNGFSRVFMQLPARFLTKKTLSPSLATPSSLKPMETGVVAGTSHDAMLRAFFPDLKPRTFSTQQAMLAALSKDDIKAVFGDAMRLSFWLESEDSSGCCTALGGNYYSTHFLGDGLAMMTRKGDANLLRALDHALLALARNGRLNEIYLRYFPSGL